MKMSQRRARSTTLKVFMMSALPHDVRKDLGKKIYFLGGKCFDLQVFKESCTHVICGQLSRSEKFLGACATGKWVLHPSYITDSAKAGSWLDEEKYEWCNIHTQNQLEVDSELSLAPRRWRYLLDGQKGAFSGWKVAVLAGAKKSKVIKRLLNSGGAELFSLKMPVNNESKVASLVTYVVVSEQTVASVLNLMTYGVMCVRPEFIGDYLIKDPPADPIDYLVLKQDAVDESWPLHRDIFLPESQTPKCTGGLQESIIEYPLLKSSTFISTSPCSLQDVNNSHVTSTIKQTSLDMIPLKHEMSVKAFAHKLKSEGKTVLQFILTKHSMLTSEDSKLQEIETKPLKQQIMLHQQLIKDEVKQNQVNIKTEEPANDINAEHLEYMLMEEQDQGNTIKEETDKQIIDNTCNMEVEQSDVQGVVTIDLTLDDEDDLTSDTFSNKRNDMMTRTQFTSLKGDVMQDKQIVCMPVEEGIIDMQIKVNTREKPTFWSPHQTSNAEYDTATMMMTKKEAVESSDTHCIAIIDLTSDDDDEVALVSDVFTSESNKILSEKKLSQLFRNEILHHRNKPSSQEKDKILTGTMYSTLEKSSVSANESDHRNNIAVNISSKENTNNSDNGSLMAQSKSKADKQSVAHTTMTSVTPITKFFKPSAVKVQRIEDVAHSLPDNQENRKFEISASSTLLMQEKTNINLKDWDCSPQESQEKTFKISRFTASLVQKAKTNIINLEAIKTTSPPNKNIILEDNRGFQNFNACAGRKRKCDRRGQSRSSAQISDFNELPEIDTPSVSLDESQFRIPMSVQDHSNPCMDVNPLCYASKGGQQQISSCEWCQNYVVQGFINSEVLSDVQRLPSHTSDFFEVILEGGFVKEALHDLNSRISFKYHPDEHTLSSLMRTALLKAETELVANLSYQVLENVIKLHPPVTKELQNVYLQALSGKNLGGQWAFIKDCISAILLSDDNCRRNNMLLLNVIVHILQCNLYHYRMAQNDIKSKYSKSHPMLIQILWGHSNHVVANSKCTELFDLMVDVIQQYITMGQDGNRHSWFEVVQNVLWMVAMCADCSRQVECQHDGIGALHMANSSVFVHEISRRLIGLDLQTPILDKILHCLPLPWLCVGICLQMLNIMDDYLLAGDHIPEGEVVNLHLIANKYFFLLPYFQMVHKEKAYNITESKSCSVGLQVEETGWQAECFNENTIKKENTSRRTNSVNKRNIKGETPLQVACIRNNVADVKRLLNEPGIDINTKDNAGWTPLHEACLHGHIECVRELMRYVPRTTLDCYFNKGKTYRKIDLLTSDSEGITPLHDAVQNGHIEVCKILLQHGGTKLLEVRTCEGLTPLDLAKTDDMHTLLSSFLSNKRRHSSSLMALNDCKDSIDCNHDIRMHLPRDSLYEEVLHLDGVRIYADTKSLLHYINLVSLLITNYVTARNLTELLEMDSQKLHVQNNARIECNNSLQVASLLEAKNMDAFSESLMIKLQSDSTEKENILFVSKEDLNTNNNNISEGHRSIPCSQNECRECSDINNDLDVLKHASQYLGLFTSHLERICHPLDVPKVKHELKLLCFLFDYLHCL